MVSLDPAVFIEVMCVQWLCSEIAKHLSLPPVKLHCSMLAEDAIKAAVKDYKAKRAQAASQSEPVAATAWS